MDGVLIRQPGTIRTAVLSLMEIHCGNGNYTTPTARGKVIDEPPGESFMLTLPKHNRYEYSVINERKDYSWPGGKRLAFCVTTNIEGHAYCPGHRRGPPQ